MFKGIISLSHIKVVYSVRLVRDNTFSLSNPIVASLFDLRAKIKTNTAQPAKFPDRKIFAGQKYIHNSRRNLQTKKVKHTQSSR